MQEIAEEAEYCPVWIAGRYKNVQVAIIIVSFRNPGDVEGLLQSLAKAQPQPSFKILIAENGGAAAMDDLLQTLRRADCCSSDTALPHLSEIVRHHEFHLLDNKGTPAAHVHVAEMPDNLGYAGAINSCLRLLLQVAGWNAVWILNPDTQVMPSALEELATHSSRYAKGMVGSRLVGPAHPDRVHTRGLGHELIKWIPL